MATAVVNKTARAFERADKLSKVLALALADLRKAERMKGFEVHMDWWISTRGATCKVCLAGSVMAMRFSLRQMPGGDMPEENKMMALEDLRNGNVRTAYWELTGKYGHGDLDRRVPSYHEDRPGWWKAMKTLLADLKRAGL